MKSGALSVQLAGTVNNNRDTINILLKGTVKLFLPGNSAVAPTAEVKIITGGDVGCISDSGRVHLGDCHWRGRDKSMHDHCASDSHLLPPS
jgi:hypothetical protein